MKNKEFLWNLADSICRRNELPMTITINTSERAHESCPDPNGIDIELQWADDSQEIIRAVVAHDCTAIADLHLDGVVVSLEDDYNDWLNDEFNGFYD